MFTNLNIRKTVCIKHEQSYHITRVTFKPSIKEEKIGKREKTLKKSDTRENSKTC